MVDRDFFATLSHSARWPAGEALLRDRIGWHRDRLSHCVHSSGGARLTHPHAEPDGIPEQNPGPPGARETISPPGGRLSCGEFASPGPWTQAIGRNQHLYLRIMAGMYAGAVLFHAFVGLVLLLVWLNSFATLLFVRR